MAKIAQPIDTTLINTNVVDTHIYFKDTEQYDDGDEFVGRGHASTPLTPDPNKLYQRVVTEAEYVDNRRYNYRLFKGEIVQLEPDSPFYKVVKDINISWKAGDVWTSSVAKPESVDFLYTEDGVNYLVYINVWVLEGEFLSNYTVIKKLVSASDQIEVSRSISEQYPIRPIPCADDRPKIGDQFAHDNGTTVSVHTVTEEPEIPSYYDINYGDHYEELPKYVVSYYYVSPIEEQLLVDKNNTTVVVKDSNISIELAPLREFNSLTIAEVTCTTVQYTINLVSASSESGSINVDCTVDTDGLLGFKPVTKLIQLDRVYIMSEVESINITIGNNGSETSVGYVGIGMTVDEGVTEYNITAGLKDYNNYTPDAWGEIEESVKPIRRTFSISVVVEMKDFDKLYRRHLAMKGKIITLDGTDGELDSLTARGIITDINHTTVINNGELANTYKYKMTFLEVI